MPGLCEMTGAYMNILWISLGCDKNLADSEAMLGALSKRGYAFTDDESQADVVIINTCCFIGDAKEESIQNILEMAELKKAGQIQALIVTGCLAQRYQDEIREEIEEVDAILGTTAIDKICQAVEEALQGKKGKYMEDIHALPHFKEDGRMVTTGGHYAYLKIAEGCDKCCTYCIIPKVRGRYRSFPMEELILEARRLAAGGVKELILVAQETTLYGVDLYGKKSLAELLHKLCEIPELVWIRILYCYPEEIDEELIEAIQSEEKVCKYLDIPIQHCADRILKKMGRRTDKKSIVEKIALLRSRIPDITLRTTLISGFPSETEEEHAELLSFVDEMEFDRLGVFAYSREEDTPAADMPEQIKEAVKERRRAELMELQQEIAFEKAEAMAGKKVTAMVEGKIADEDACVARTGKDAPGVDGYLFINTKREFMTGEFVEVTVTGSYEYDLIGEICDEFTE